MTCVGACDDFKTASIADQQSLTGRISHSAQLDDEDAEGKIFLFIGGGVSSIKELKLAVAAKA
jgi:hypothetical protein